MLVDGTKPALMAGMAAGTFTECSSCVPTTRASAVISTTPCLGAIALPSQQRTGRDGALVMTRGQHESPGSLEVQSEQRQVTRAEREREAPGYQELLNLSAVESGPAHGLTDLRNRAPCLRVGSQIFLISFNTGLLTLRIWFNPCNPRKDY